MNETTTTQPKTILLTGATGYIGGRLLNRLEEQGYHVRCMARRPQNLAARLAENSEAVYGDVNDFDSLLAAMNGVDAAFYLIHSMGETGQFEQKDRQAAQYFGEAARQSNLQRIVYLGGLAKDDEPLSSHLRSRIEVGRILRNCGVPTLEFRSSIVIGSGSLSFEMIRSLVERLPIMITPRWVRIKTQPISVEDLLTYLERSMEVSLDQSTVVEIGGKDVVSYGELMYEYARQRGLRRFMIPVPLLTPKLSSLWLGLVTPIYSRVGKILVDSIRHPTVVKDDAAAKLFNIQPRGLADAIALALRNEDHQYAQTRWSDALSMSGGVKDWAGIRFGSRMVDSRTRHTPLRPEQVFPAIERIGGDTGWYYGTFLWKIRGYLDLLVGGIGLRRGRRDPDKLAVGEAVDFWRVEAIEPNQRLLLHAEMRVPGRAWLQFEVQPDEEGGSQVRQTAIYDPIGLLGRLYWFALFPVHAFVFEGMLRNLVRSAERKHEIDVSTQA